MLYLVAALTVIAAVSGETLRYGPPPPPSGYNSPLQSNAGGNLGGNLAGSNHGGSLGSFGGALGGAAGDSLGGGAGAALGGAAGAGGAGGSTGATIALDEGCGNGQAKDHKGDCVDAMVTRNIYLYEAPALPVPAPIPPENIPQPKVHLNFVFIRTPTASSTQKPMVVAPKQKTLVYVLSKKPTASETPVIEVEATPSQPEVFFVEYNEGEDAQLPGDVTLQEALSQSVQAGVTVDALASPVADAAGATGGAVLTGSTGGLSGATGGLNGGIGGHTGAVIGFSGSTGTGVANGGISTGYTSPAQSVGAGGNVGVSGAMYGDGGATSYTKRHANNGVVSWLMQPSNSRTFNSFQG